jgi:hypothetical protein
MPPRKYAKSLLLRSQDVRSGNMYLIIETFAGMGISRSRGQSARLSSISGPADAAGARPAHRPAACQAGRHVCVHCRAHHAQHGSAARRQPD